MNVDLHTHTYPASDCSRISYRDYIAWCAEHGVEGVALTNHGDVSDNRRLAPALAAEGSTPQGRDPLHGNIEPDQGVDAVASSGSMHVMTVLGEAGLGTSRLLEEFRIHAPRPRGLDDVLIGRVVSEIHGLLREEVDKGVAREMGR